MNTVLYLLRHAQEVMARSWSDFDFALPQCETSTQCQSRFKAQVQHIVNTFYDHTVLISSHGMSVGLFLKTIVPAFDFEDWKNMKFPDLFRIKVDGYRTVRLDRSFTLPSLQHV